VKQIQNPNEANSKKKEKLSKFKQNPTYIKIKNMIKLFEKSIIE